MSDTPQGVSRSAVRFFSGTLLSRVTGMVRDMTMAFYFGTSPALAAFLLAYRFVYLIRRLFGEGLLRQGFIPHYEERKALSERGSALYFRDLFWTFALVLFVVLGLIEGGLFFFGRLGVFSGGGVEIAHLSALILPGLFFICLFGLTSALLQSEKHFFLSSAAPIAFNLVWMAGVIALGSFPTEEAVVGLSLVLVIAFAFQWGVTIPRTWEVLRRNLSLKEIFQLRVFSRSLKSITRPLFLGMIGVASMQVNSAIDSVFARFSSLEGPAYLWYAIRMEQLPLALFGIALSSALLPALSRTVEEKNEEGYQDLVRFGIKRTFTLIFPCVVGIFVLGVCSVNLLFGRGDFSSVAIVETTKCLWGYGLGLLPAALVQILAPAFYAKKDYTTPTKAFIFTAIMNIFFDALFVFGFGWGASSIAIATSGAACFNALYLYRHLRSKSFFSSSVVKVGTAGLMAGILTLFFGHFGLGDSTVSLFLQKGVSFASETLVQLSQFLLQAGVFFALFFLFCFWLKAEDVNLNKITGYFSSK
ncbi:MAG: Lipid II flippase MurJ [Chlamydiae bacterium]|nr:Lipid II flippase MurJ [Chlamydiota bacterium]